MEIRQQELQHLQAKQAQLQQRDPSLYERICCAETALAAFQQATQWDVAAKTITQGAQSVPLLDRTRTVSCAYEFACGRIFLQQIAGAVRMLHNVCLPPDIELDLVALDSSDNVLAVGECKQNCKDLLVGFARLQQNIRTLSGQARIGQIVGHHTEHEMKFTFTEASFARLPRDVENVCTSAYLFVRPGVVASVPAATFGKLLNDVARLRPECAGLRWLHSQLPHFQQQHGAAVQDHQQQLALVKRHYAQVFVLDFACPVEDNAQVLAWRCIMQHVDAQTELMLCTALFQTRKYRAFCRELLCSNRVAKCVWLCVDVMRLRSMNELYAVLQQVHRMVLVTSCIPSPHRCGYNTAAVHTALLHLTAVLELLQQDQHHSADTDAGVTITTETLTTFAKLLCEQAAHELPSTFRPIGTSEWRQDVNSLKHFVATTAQLSAAQSC
eukprot:TRINITY_DN12820_c0_g1_i1.p1 TRINITY_DN12820_c0_g1~~TRINITY_DN12820_c0_g1_i1.p1  ORF type:complete len:441 (-),score=95.12 TRINITY_DN12820_c0_g1_i1:554-1876(-)